MLGDEGHADETARERQQQLEVAAGGAVAECDFEAPGAARHLYLMRRRVGISEARRAVDLHAETARCALPAAIADVPQPPRVAGAVHQLRVFERDLARLPRVDREDSRPDQSLPSELDQRRVPFLSDDRFVNRAGLCGIHRLAAQLLIALPEGIAREDRLPRQCEA